MTADQVGGATHVQRFVRVTARVETLQDVATWLQTALENGPNGSRLQTPVTLTVELPK
jgi:hypothetical protein